MLDKMRDNAQSWVIKVLFAIIILAFIFAFAGPKSQGDQVMAYVKGEPITVTDFQRALSNQDNSSVETRAQLISQMANNELIRQLTAEHGIVVTDAELQAYIRSIPAFRDEDGDFDLHRYKALVGDTESFEQESRDELLKAKMARFLALPAMPTEAEVRAFFEWQNEQTSIQYTLIPLADYLGRAIVLPEDVKKYYEENTFLFQQPERSEFQALVFTPEALADNAQVSDAEVASYYEAFGANLKRPRTMNYREVVLPVGANPTQADVDAASAQAALILEDLASGASFEDLAAANARPGDNAPGALKSASADQLPAPLAQALDGLEVGGISQPAFTIEGLTIVKLEGVEEARDLTLDEARETIIDRIAREQAADILDDKVEEAIAVLSQGGDMTAAAEAAGMSVTDVAPTTRADFMSANGLTEDDAALIFAQEVGEVPTVPLKLDDGYLLATRTKVHAERTLPLEDVRAEITAKLLLEESRRLAEIDAQAILAGQNTDFTLMDSTPFTRSGPAPVPGVDARMIEAAFTTDEGSWLPQPFAVSEGFLVAKAGPRVEPTAEAWQQQRPNWLQTAGEVNRRELNMAFQAHVFLSAQEDGSIEIVRQDLLQ